MRLHKLESKAYVNGGNVQIALRDLPPGYKVASFILRLEAVMTTGAAAALIAGRELFRLFSAIEIGEQIRTTGVVQHFTNWMLRGAEDYLPASVPATRQAQIRYSPRSSIAAIAIQSGSAGSSRGLSSSL